MKHFKKIMFIVLALAPLFAVVAFVLSNVGNQSGVEYIPIGEVSFVDSADGVSLTVTPNSWAERVLVPLYGSEPVGGFYGAMGRFVNTLESSVGIPCTFATVLVVFYLGYLFVIEFLCMLVDLLTFVPRKCKEVLS